MNSAAVRVLERRLHARYVQQLRENGLAVPTNPIGAQRLPEYTLGGVLLHCWSQIPTALPAVGVSRTRWEFPHGEHSGRQVTRAGLLPRFRVDGRDFVSLEPLTNAAFWRHAKITHTTTARAAVTTGGKSR